MARQSDKNPPEPADQTPTQPPATTSQHDQREKSKSSQGQDRANFDIFYEQTVYPEAASVFSFFPSSIEEIKDDCLVVLDTSVLLLPYGFNQAALSQIEKTYQRLIKEQRLIVPGQAAREFAKNRGKKIADMYNTISQRKAALPGRDALPGGTDKSYRLLEEMEEYKHMLEQEQGMLELASQIGAKKKEYVSAIDNVLTKIARWNWDDPISVLYSNLFTPEVVFEPGFDNQKMRANHSFRKTHHIPPGYKDSETEAGDLLIWHTILALGTEYKKDLAFVSGDMKADWRVRAEEGKHLYTRYELVDEYRRASGGHSFHILELSALLELYDVGTEIVAQVRTEERKRDRIMGELTVRTAEENEMLIEALINWLQEWRADVRDSVVSEFFGEQFRMLVELTDGSTLMVFGEIDPAQDGLAGFKERLPSYRIEAFLEGKQSCLLAIISKDQRHEIRFLNHLNAAGGKIIVGALMTVIGYVEEGKFKVQSTLNFD